MALIIGGHPRSGTTILNILCQRHPGMVLTGEFRTFLQLDVPYLAYIRSIRKDWYRRGILSHSGRNAPLDAKLTSARFLAMYMLRLRFCGQRVIGYEQVVSTLHKMFPSAQLVGDKYPRYIFSIDRLVRIPGLKRVIIYRDARDVVSSYLRMARTVWRNDRFILENRPTARKTAHAWVKAISLMEQHAGQLHAIRYETFVESPRQELDRLAAYLDVAPEGFKARRVVATKIGGHRTGLTPDEIADVLQVAGPTMEHLGYSL